jgi:DNA-binding transcriptional regulator YiaG
MFHYTASGLDNIWLKNGYKTYNAMEGGGFSIHDLDNLHKAISLGIVKKEAPLTGKEFRFLRIELDLSQKAIGDLMDKTDQMVANWEKGNHSIPVLADAAMRTLYMESIGGSPISGLLKKLKDLDRQIHELKFELEETQEGGWQFSECA